MGEKPVINKEDKEKEIRQQMMYIYESYQQEGGNPVTSVSYFNQMVFQSQDSSIMYGLQDVYPVEINENNMRKIALYQEGQKIATIDENSNIIFSPDYLSLMQGANPQIYNLLQGLNGKNYALPDINQGNDKLPDINNKEKVENFMLKKEDLEKGRDGQSSLNGQQKSGGQRSGEQRDEDENKIEDPRSEEENMNKIAQQSGLTKEDIKSCSTIDPREKVTDEESFENIANITGQYSKIFVVASNGQTKGNSRFAFWGVTPEGKVEQIPGLEERQGVNTGKSIYAINRDGSEVKEEQTAAMFTLPNQREGFSVTIGQYGIIETTYIRRSPEENKFIGSSINSSTQKPTTREVQEFMNDRRTTDSEIQETIDRTDHQLNETEKTHIRNIDDNYGNDVALDIDANIELHDGTITTLRKEAEKLGISPEEYAKTFEETKGDCFSDKIETIRLTSPQDQDVGDSRDGRGERLTPEEEALQRMGY